MTWLLAIKQPARLPALSSPMFNNRQRFRELPCPLVDACNRTICLFSHNLSPVPAPAPTQTVPAKRRAPDVHPVSPQVPQSSRQSSASAERPTKLQRTGSAPKPVAVPTASSPPVSRASIPQCRFTHRHFRPVFLSSESMLGSQRYPFRRARYVTRLVSFSRNVVSTPYTSPSLCSFVSAACSHSGSSSHSH